MICGTPVLFGKWNSHANFIHRSHMANQYHIPELWTFCLNQSENCLHLSVTIYTEICYSYRQEYTFQDNYIKCILFSFFQNHHMKYTLFFSFKTIFLSNHYCVLFRTGTFPSCTDIHFMTMTGKWGFSCKKQEIWPAKGNIHYSEK